MLPYDIETVARLYRCMLLIRRVEEHICEVYHTDVIKSPVHLSIGQESIAAGICDALQAGDMLSNTYRCHATYIAKGGDLNAMMAELYGKRAGCAAGKAGSMHLIDMQNGVMGASAVVGTTVPVAAGYALALKRDAQASGRQAIVAAVFGDGATEEGCFSETLHFAALHALPLLFICENNRLAIHSPLEKRWPSASLARDRAALYNMPVHYIPDGDVFKVRETVSDACRHAREGKGPVFIECATYRWLEHVGPGDDHDAGYRDIEEFNRWKAGDQIARLEAMLGATRVKAITSEVEDRLAQSIRFAQACPFPSPSELTVNVYAA